MDTDRSKVWGAISALGEAVDGLSQPELDLAIAGFLSGLGRTTPSAATPQVTQSETSKVAVPPSAPAVGKKLSLVEFVNQKNPTSNTQLIATFARYLHQFENKEYITPADVSACFAKAKRKPPKNFMRDFGRTAQAGWIHPDSEQSYLTQSGQAAVDAGFDGKLRARVSKSKKKKKKAASPKGK